MKNHRSNHGAALRSGHRVKLALLAGSAFLSSLAGPAFAGAVTSFSTSAISSFSTGDIVISTVSCSVGASACDSTAGAGAGGLDTAAPIQLQELQLGTGGTSASSVGQLTLPQVSSGVNSAIS